MSLLSYVASGVFWLDYMGPNSYVAMSPMGGAPACNAFVGVCRNGKAYLGTFDLSLSLHLHSIDCVLDERHLCDPIPRFLQRIQETRRSPVHL